MSIETVLLIVIVTFVFGFVLDRWNMRLSRSRRRQAVRPSRAAQKWDPTPKNAQEAARIRADTEEEIAALAGQRWQDLGLAAKEMPDEVNRGGMRSWAPCELFRQHHVGTLTRLPVPAQHGGQSNRGEREPNEPANQMHARLRRGLEALRLAFVVVGHVRYSIVVGATETITH